MMLRALGRRCRPLIERGRQQLLLGGSSHRSSSSSTTPAPPVIDLSHWTNPDHRGQASSAARDEADALLEAASTWGFFYVKGEGEGLHREKD